MQSAALKIAPKFRHLWQLWLKNTEDRLVTDHRTTVMRVAAPALGMENSLHLSIV